MNVADYGYQGLSSMNIYFFFFNYPDHKVLINY